MKTPMACANEHNAPLKVHKLNAFAEAVQATVGGAENFYQTVERIEFDPFKLVGQNTKQGIITEEDAKFELNWKCHKSTPMGYGPEIEEKSVKGIYNKGN